LNVRSGELWNGILDLIAVFGLIRTIVARQVVRLLLLFHPWISGEEGMKNPHPVRLCGFIMMAMGAAMVVCVKVVWLSAE